MNEFLRKIKNGERPVGTFFEIGSVTAAECLGRSGFDYMIIDNEHGTFEGESTLEAVRGANLSGILPFVRVREIARSAIMKPLDIGAKGLIIPFVEKVEDIDRAKAEDKVGFIFASQSPEAVEGNAGFVEVLYKMGMRIMQLAYQRRNMLGEGVGEPTNTGLSLLGKEVVQEMNRVGMLIDTAHATEQTMIDILETSTQPTVNSHSCCLSLKKHRRNVSDELIQLQCSKGGVYCLSAYGDFLIDNGGQIGATLDDWARHMEYLLKLVGPDHVGIGFDVGEGRNAAEVQILHNGAPGTGKGPKYRYVKELVCRAQYPLVVEKLIEMGLSDADIGKVIGGNLRKLFAEVWK